MIDLEAKSGCWTRNTLSISDVILRFNYFTSFSLFLKCLTLLAPRIMSDAFSATIMIGALVGALVLPVVTFGSTDALTTRRPLMPMTRSCGSTTAVGSAFPPILHVPQWWYSVTARWRTTHSQNASDRSSCWEQNEIFACSIFAPKPCMVGVSMNLSQIRKVAMKSLMSHWSVSYWESIIG